MAGIDSDWCHDLTFYVNGKIHKLSHPDPKTTLLTFLRLTLRLTGTKLGCGEGGCGACTVMLSHMNKTTGVVEHLSCNACLTPLCGLDGYAVTTVEGMLMKTKLCLCELLKH